MCRDTPLAAGRPLGRVRGGSGAAYARRRRRRAQGARGQGAGRCHVLLREPTRA